MEALSKMKPYELGESAREDAVKYLILYLSKGTANEKRLAASAINKLTNKYSDTCKKAIPFLIENLSDAHPQVRQYTLKALAKFKLSASAIKVVQEIMIRDSAEYNRRAAEEIIKKHVDMLAKNVTQTRFNPMKAYNIKFEEAPEIKFSREEKAFIKLINEKCNISFTEKQKAAVLHRDNAALVLAVPGAGKTTVLLARTANLIINHNINPANILSITFSKASANDMKNRYNNIFSNITSIGANFSTIHSFCFELIRKYSQLNNISFTIIEDGSSVINKRTILKKCYKEFNGETVDDDALDELINSIGYVKNMLYSTEEIMAYSQQLDIDKFQLIYDKYEAIKKENNYIDYDDMLTVAYGILRNDKNMLERYRALYDYIQIDEGQDTSKIQHKIMQLIAYPKNNIFIVADDDQSIYSFRGSYPNFLIDIDSLYSGTKKIFIEENFRSTTNIVSIANKFIKANEVRFNKELYTRNKSGNPAELVILNDEKSQMDFIVNNIKNMNTKISCAILYRNNMTSINLADELSRRGVSFYLKDYNRFFFKHFITEDIKCFMNLILNNNDLEAFSKVYYRINSYVLKETILLMKDNWKVGKNIFENIESLNINDMQKKSLNRLKAIITSMKFMKPEKIIEVIENDLGYAKYIKDNAKLLGYSYEGLRVILTNIKALSTKCSSIASFIFRLSELELIMEEATKYRPESLVTLSTMHSSKGLEFSKVYIIDLIENIIPTRSSIENFELGQKDKLEEERRLLYVAMTRARHMLYLIILENRNDDKTIPSRFVDELKTIMKEES